MRSYGENGEIDGAEEIRYPDDVQARQGSSAEVPLGSGGGQRLMQLRQANLT